MNRKEISRILGPKFESMLGDCVLALDDLRLSKDAAILDIGTGKGYCAISLASQGFQVITGEPSTDTSRYAGQAWSQNAEKIGVRDKISFQAFDATHLTFESATFDAVFLFGVLHHVDEHDRNDVFSEALRVAKESGVVVFFEPRRKMVENSGQTILGIATRQSRQITSPTRLSKGVK